MEDRHGSFAILVRCQAMSSSKDGGASDTEGAQQDGAQWDEVKRARNRVNSRRTREREKEQLDRLESERARLWLSNDALRYQNSHLNEAIKRVREHQAQQMQRSEVESTRPTVPHNISTAALLAQLRNKNTLSSERTSMSHMNTGVPQMDHAQVAVLASVGSLGQASLPLGQLGMSQLRGLNSLAADHQILPPAFFNLPAVAGATSTTPTPSAHQQQHWATSVQSANEGTHIPLLSGIRAGLGGLQLDPTLLQLQQDLARIGALGRAFAPSPSPIDAEEESKLTSSLTLRDEIPAKKRRRKKKHDA